MGKFWEGQNVVKSDKCMVVSRLLGAGLLNIVDAYAIRPILQFNVFFPYFRRSFVIFLN